MYSYDNTARQDIENGQAVMGRKLEGSHEYPPPEALPEYVNRALPPPPGSGSSSVYTSANEDPQWQNLSNHQVQDHDPDISPAGVLDEGGLAMIRPLQLLSLTPPRFQQQDNPQQPVTEIAAPQPRYPPRVVLETGEDGEIISPMSGPSPGNTAEQQYEVSPISLNGSMASFPSDISDYGRISGASRGSSSSRDVYLFRRQVSHGKHPIVFPSADLLTMSDLDSVPLHRQLHHIRQINLRYSDPGSPITAAVIHPPTSFPSDPNLRLSRRFDADRREYREARDAKPPPMLQQYQHQHQQVDPPGHPGTRTRSSSTPVSSGGPKVAFAGAVEGFSARNNRASSRRTAPAPPPLKLSERPLAEQYVKTPFPVLGAEAQRGQRQLGSGVAEQVKKSENENENESGFGNAGGGGGGRTKKRNRVSSLPGLVFGKALRHKFFWGGDGGSGNGDSSRGGAELSAQKSKDARQEERTSGVPKVKDILARAKSLRLGRGLGLGLGSEEARREERREEMKRQIRISEPLRDL